MSEPREMDVIRGAMTTFWDHAAHWTEVIGNWLSTPWFRLSRYCYERWRRSI